MGLELKPSKTRLTHTFHNLGKEKAGFDFLGFSIQQHKVGKYNSGKNSQGELLGFKTLVKPSKKSTKLHYKKIAEIVDNSKALKQESLIGRLNPVIRGWCNYYSTAVGKKMFSLLDKLTQWKLWKWANKRHKNKGKTFVKNKYFSQEFYVNKQDNKPTSRDWVFATTENNDIKFRLDFHQDTKISRHIKVKGNSSPYDGNLVYWSSRMGRNPLMPQRKANLLKKQKGKCNWRNLMFKLEDLIEEDHIIPTSKGGKNQYNNLQLLHRHCHDSKTRIDGSNEPQFKPYKIPNGWYWEEGMLIT